MNPDEIESPSSQTVPTSTGRRIRVRSLKKSSISQEASLPSIPSDDNDWVSPFTLPPLPAFKKNRSQLDRSPKDPAHNRSGSSAYYAAAWGSPYATPSPNQSPAPRVDRNQSLDLESSPLAIRHSTVDPAASRHARKRSLPVQDSIQPLDLHSSPSPVDPLEKSQRRNWLSESEDSESEPKPEFGQTPTQSRFTSQREAPSSIGNHHVQESVDTITPETFNGTSSITNRTVSTDQSSEMAEQLPSSSPVEEKPLPHLPTDPHVAENEPPSGPALQSTTAPSQRAKKKVSWKGKSCIIGMPSTDREQAGLPPVLTPQERQDLLLTWVNMGYPVRGFSIDNWSSSAGHVGSASRPTYPDPIDMDVERKTSQVNVQLPNQAEWDAWVNYLKEEKLRALGVTPSTSEAPASTQSPFSSSMSRVSSVYPGMAASPPIPPMSAVSARAQMSNSPFSPAMSNPGSLGFPSLSHRGTPGLSNGRGMHGYTQSVAFTGMGARMGSPFDQSMTQNSPFGSNIRSPDGLVNGRRPWSPGHVQNMQSMATLISPVNPSPNDFLPQYSPNPQLQALQALQRQQDARARQIANHQRQMSMFPLRTISVEQMQQFPLTPKAVSPEREPPEIVQPTPRTHRHNLSAALEKGVTESIAASSKELSQVMEAGKQEEGVQGEEAQQAEEGEIIDETEQEELPILHRPETLKEADEKAEIETNPSIAGTPLLLDDKNPFSNINPLSLVSEQGNSRLGLGHSSHPSLSKLNVQAKEFSPSKAPFSPSGGVFSFDGNAFASNTSSPGKSASSGPRFGHKHNPSSLGLNVAAPVFTPSFSAKPASLSASGDKSAPGSARISQDFPADVLSESATPARSTFDSQAMSFNLSDNTIPEEPAHPHLSSNPETWTFGAGRLAEQSTTAQPAFDPEASNFSLGGALDNQWSAPAAAEAAFDPRSSTFSFQGNNRSEQGTPSQTEFDPKSSTFSTFSFRSTGFNVEAPEFKPSGMPLTKIGLSQGMSVSSGTPNSYTGSMFGDVVIDPSNKPNRRSKALVIRKPHSREGSAAPEDKEEPDKEEPDKEESRDDGRPTAPTERHKRAKTVGVKNEEILFADSSPFAFLAEDPESAVDEVKDTRPETAKDVDDAKAPVAAAAKREEPPEDAHEGQREIPVAEQEQIMHDPEPASATPIAEVVADTEAADKDRVTIPEAVEQGASREEETVSPQPRTQNQQEVQVDDQEGIKVADQPPTNRQSGATTEETDLATPEEPGKLGPAVEEFEPAPAPSLSADAPAFEPGKTVTDKPNPGLPAVAKPFQFSPAVKDFVPEPKPEPLTYTQATPPKPKKGGLMASRFAASPSPEPAVPPTVERISPPPQHLFGEQVERSEGEPGHKFRDEQGSFLIDVAENVSDRGEAVSRDNLPIDLEKYRERDSGTASADSQPGDISYEEINAVMKQFEEDPDLGVIREETPVKSTPLIDMRFPQQFRSDAPSPSPARRLERPFHPDRQQYGLGFDMSGVHQLNYGGSGEVSDWNADLDLSPGQQDKLEARAQFFDDHVNDLVDNVLENRLAPLERALQNIQNSVQQVVGRPRHSRRSMSTENKESDADDEDEYDAYEGYSHYRSKSPSKRNRQQERIKAAVMEAMTVAQSTLNAPQVDLSSVQKAVEEMRELAHKAAVVAQPASDTSAIQEALQEIRSLARKEIKAPELDTTELIRTVAEMKALTQQRAAEPQLDVQSVQATLAEIRQIALEKSEIDLSAVLQGLADLKTRAEEQPREPSQDLKSIIEDVLNTHPNLNEPRESAHAETSAKMQAKINDLEAMLKVAEKRADGEAALRREAEEENDNLHRFLKEAKDQTAVHKDASETARKNLESFLQEKQEYRGMNIEMRDLRDKNEALEKTLNEYRSFKEQIKDELEKERSRTEKLARALQDARHQHRDQVDSRGVLREQLQHLQGRMAKISEDVRHDEAEWRKREHDLMSKNQLLQAALDHETNRRARMELDAEKMHKEHRESLVFRSKHDTAQQEISRLANIIVGLQAENKSHQDAAFDAQRELAFLQKHHEGTLASATTRLQDELEASKTILQNLQSDTDARIARLRGQLDTAAVELQETKSKHEATIRKMLEDHNVAIQDAAERYATELEHRLAFHEEKLGDLRTQHARDVKNAEEDRKALEQRYEEKLSLSEDKVKHLESRVEDLKHSLEITQKAARAAAESAISKGANLPTPASSVVASPPHRSSISSASIPLQRGSDLPEKISPQALRETIMVLQDQLQNREQKIDKLEAELAAIDKSAPAKVKERDTEIVMLRELLDVRLDDLQELIATLEKPDYNRQAVKDVAIRLKTQIKMDQQLRERAISGASLASNLPSSITSGISNLTQSPRAMVAAAAWGNWRKIRDSGVSAVSDFASNIGSQTPSRSGSNQSNPLTGIMTPPATSKSQGDGSRPSTARPLAAAAAARRTSGPGSPSTGARPLRSFSSQPRTLSGARPLARRGTNESRRGSSASTAQMSSTKVEPPSTPLQTNVDSDFGDDVDDDASPLDGKERGFESDDAEVVNPTPAPIKLVSPRTSRSSMSKPLVSPRASRYSRHSSGKPVSPRALRASAGVSQHDVVEVFEED